MVQAQKNLWLRIIFYHLERMCNLHKNKIDKKRNTS